MFYQPSRGNGDRFHHKSLSDSEGTREFQNNRNHSDFVKSTEKNISIDNGSRFQSCASLSNSSYLIKVNFSGSKDTLNPLKETQLEFTKGNSSQMDSQVLNEKKEKSNDEISELIPKAIIERSIRPEKFDLNQHKKDIVELIAKLESESSENSNSSSCSSKGSESKKTNDTINQELPKVNSSDIQSFTLSQSNDKCKLVSNVETTLITPEIKNIVHIASASIESNCLSTLVRDRNTDISPSQSFESQRPFFIDEQVVSYPLIPPYYPNIQNRLDFRMQNFYPPYDVNICPYNNLSTFGNPVFNTNQPDYMYSTNPRLGYYVPSIARVDVSFNHLPTNETLSKAVKKVTNTNEATKNSSQKVKPKVSNNNEHVVYYKNGGHCDIFNDNQFKLSEDVDRDVSTVEMAKDQHGSRLIQNRIENASPSEIFVLINELTQDEKVLVVLVGDVFGNYVIQKLLDHGNEEHRIKIISQIKGNILLLAMQMYGCRVIQKAIECGTKSIQVLITKELESHVLECIKDQNGNHVIQKCIEKIDPILLDFIIVEISGKVVELSSHPYGCRVIQRIIERFNDVQKSVITKELFADIPSLVLDQYGNYVIQHILDHRKSEKDRDYIFNYVKDNLFLLSSHKFASNVVEKCLVSGSKEERQELISEIIDNSVGSEEDIVFRMMKDAYANYVIQKMIDVIIFDKEHELFNSLVNKIKPHYPNLRKINYGKHIINKIDKICNKLANNRNQSLNSSKQDNNNIDEINHISADYNRYYGDNCRIKGYKFPKDSKTNNSNEHEGVMCDSLVEFPALIGGSSKVTISSDF